MYIEPMSYLTNVGKRVVLSKESKAPCPVGEAAAASDDTNDQKHMQQKMHKKHPRTHKITNEQISVEEEGIYYGLSTEDFLELLFS
jgi:hypothetical protein|tara:strand:+ start:709 stop:966 length:258 start_codon:yes stop_codon:yes gene_type:complete